MSKAVNEIVTKRIFQLLKEGKIPWQRPWTSRAGRPRNGVSNRPYRGINALICSGMVSGYSDPNWYTLKQIKKMELTLKKSQKSTPVVFWNWTDKKQSDGSTERFPFTTYYKCFNRQQIEGAEKLWPPAEETKPNEDWELDAEAIVKKYQEDGGPEIDYGMGSACYKPTIDKIEVPSRADHTSVAEYWATLFHEITHSTGSKKRLNRSEGMKGMKGNHDYSKEELVAEMGACFLLADLGVEKHIENSAAYIRGWLEKLEGEEKILMQAAQQAEKSCDYVRGESYGEK
tara:strand:+ start:1408 stop:2268 length:861 start_codon:yes stop_codon:yes gene_type:complete